MLSALRAVLEVPRCIVYNASFKGIYGMDWQKETRVQCSLKKTQTQQ